MGIGYGIRCKSCYYGREFMLGIGMMPLHYDYDFSYLHPKTRAQVKRVIGDLPIKDVQYEKELFQCKTCNNLYDRPLLEITYGDNKTFKTNQKCSKCKGEAKIVENLEESIREVPCPKCKEKSLQIETHIMWD